MRSGNALMRLMTNLAHPAAGTVASEEGRHQGAIIWRQEVCDGSGLPAVPQRKGVARHEQTWEALCEVAAWHREVAWVSTPVVISRLIWECLRQSSILIAPQEPVRQRPHLALHVVAHLIEMPALVADDPQEISQASVSVVPEPTQLVHERRR